MELQCSTLSIVTTAVILVLLILIKRARKFNPERNTRLPPGPWKLPFIGNTHQLIGGVPHRVLRDLSNKHGPDLMHLKLGQLDHIIVSSAEAAREILKTHDLNFASRPPLMASTILGYNNSGVAFSPYGTYWRQLRKVCVLELLSARRVKESCAMREEEVLNLVEDISSMTGSTVNLTEKLASLANKITSRAAFGAKCNHEERFISAAKKGVVLASGFNVADLYPSLPFLGALSRLSSKLKTLHREIDAVLDEIIEEHGKKRQVKSIGQEDEGSEEDLVDVLLSLQENGALESPLTMANIKAVIFDIFLGGTETASSTLEWTMTQLIRHPEVMKKVQSEVRQVLKGKEKVEDEDLKPCRYMKLVIKEALRCHLPAPLLLPRVCSQSCNVMGYDIPPGYKVLINAWAIGRDPRYWEDGESFRPERFDGDAGACVDYIGDNFSYIPFGGGRRICPGMTFAVANVELVLALLLFHFDWELPDGMNPEDLDMMELFGSTLRRRTELCLVAKPHNLSLPIF